MQLLHLPTATLLAVLVSLPSTLASIIPQHHVWNTPSPTASPLPLLIWHGLGDNYNAEGLREVGSLASKIHPGTYVKFIRLDEDGGSDRTATFLGNVSAQIAAVCEDLRLDPKLQSRRVGADYEEEVMRVDALGFSQGGQFLRALLQRCDGLEMRSLVTFGSQHNGIAQFQLCSSFDFVCKGAAALIKGNAWTDTVQSRVVPAQYYRTLNETTGLASDEYLAHSSFLADINNERVLKTPLYVGKVASLEKLVMFMFDEDKTVIPKESGWFAEVNATSGHVTPLRERTLYKEDWIGLKALDEKGGLVFRTAPGKHMELSEKLLEETFGEYFGPETAVEVEGRREGGLVVQGADGR